MADEKLTDKVAFETLIRSGRRQNKIEWVPVAGQEDRDALNQAIRKAAGRGEPEPDAQPFPWKSVAGDESEGT